MSMEIQVNLSDLLRVLGPENVQVRADMNGSDCYRDADGNVDLTGVYAELADQEAPADIGYAQWMMTADTLIKLPGYEFWRSYGVFRNDEAQEVIISFSAGSSSPFMVYMRELERTHAGQLKLEVF